MPSVGPNPHGDAGEDVPLCPNPPIRPDISRPGLPEGGLAPTPRQSPRSACDSLPEKVYILPDTKVEAPRVPMMLAKILAKRQARRIMDSFAQTKRNEYQHQVCDAGSCNGGKCGAYEVLSLREMNLRFAIKTERGLEFLLNGKITCRCKCFGPQ